MADDYSNIFKNQRSVRRSDFGNVYDPYPKVNALKIIKRIAVTVVILSIVIGTVSFFSADADAATFLIG
jgi:hypothetical protein